MKSQIVTFYIVTPYKDVVGQRGSEDHVASIFTAWHHSPEDHNLNNIKSIKCVSEKHFIFDIQLSN
jgi:hypothetical protein